MIVKWGLPLIVVFVLVIVVKIISPDDQTPKDSVRIAVSKTPLSAPLYIADELGLFQRCGIETELIDASGGKRAFQKLQNNEVDFSTSSDSVVAYQVAQGSDFNVLASFASSENDVKILSHLPVLKSTGGRNIRLGYWSDSASEHLVKTYLQLEPIADHIDIVGASPEELMTRFLSAELDAFSLWEPYIWKVIQQLPESETYYLLPTEGLMSLHFMLLSSPVMKQRPNVTEKLLAALYLAIQSIHLKPELAKEIMVSRLAVEPAFLDWVWDDYLFQLRNAADLRFVMLSNVRWLSQKEIDFSPHLAQSESLSEFNVLVQRWCRGL